MGWFLAGELPLQEFGFAAAVTGVCILAFLWITKKLIDYIVTSGGKQVETLTALTNTVARLTDRMDAHDYREQERHDALLQAIRGRNGRGPE